MSAPGAVLASRPIDPARFAYLKPRRSTMRRVLVTANALFITLTSILSGQTAHVVDIQVGVGGAATGGGGYGENGGVVGRLGIAVSVGREWKLRTDAMLFGRLVSTSCVDVVGSASPATCGNSFPGTIRAVDLDVLHPLPLLGTASRPLTVSAGVGAAFVASSGPSSSTTAMAANLGAEWTVVHVGRSAISLAARGLLIPNVHARTLWLIPVTVGIQF